MGYESLLKRGRDNLPDTVSARERFEIPNVRGHLQGTKTIISNFNTICSILHREPVHVLKYLLRELATSGELKQNLLVFNSKISSKIINIKIRTYANTYVLCSECSKPDTSIITENNLPYLKCQACGCKHRVKL